MFAGPPRENEFVSWLFVVIWTLFIFVTIPFARAVQNFVSQHWGRDLFEYAVLVSIVIALIVAARYVILRRPTSRGSYFWLLSVAAIFIGYTIELGKKSPEEATHFIQYGLLGILVYRSLTHRVRDISIYLSAAIICGTIGTLDEVIQWLTPKRHWDLRDIWINFFAGSLVQIAIAKGLKPEFIAGRFGRSNLRLFCCLTLVAAASLGVCLLNTPERITWYAERIPKLDFLIKNGSVMIEYGYLYKDPDIGVFKSRFSHKELKQIDIKLAKDAAKILDRFKGRSYYRKFLEIYTPMTDPFVHEARVHLYSRNFNFSRSVRFEDNPKKYARRLTVAFHENQIMEKYFSNTLRQSSYTWSEKEKTLARKHLLKDMAYDSLVSRSLITRVSEAQVAVFFVLIVLGLLLIYWYLGKHQSTRFHIY